MYIQMPKFDCDIYFFKYKNKHNKIDQNKFILVFI